MQNYKLALFASVVLAVALLSGCASGACCTVNGQEYYSQSPTFITGSNGNKYFPYGNSSSEEGEAYYYDRSTYYRKGVTYYSDGDAYR